MPLNLQPSKEKRGLVIGGMTENLMSLCTNLFASSNQCLFETQNQK